jgi:hypothetical protein
MEYEEIEANKIWVIHRMYFRQNQRSCRSVVFTYFV